jgi:hypothetical protein
MFHIRINEVIYIVHNIWSLNGSDYDDIAFGDATRPCILVEI